MDSSLDPIFPLPAGTGIPPVKQGRGRELFDNDVHVASGQTYRSFYVMWEQVERRAAENYPKYVGGPMGHVADTWLEAVVWCRNVAYPNAGIEAISEKKAQKIRKREIEAAKQAKQKAKQKPGSEAATADDPSQCPKCGDNRTLLKKKFKGEKVWKCADCGHRFPRSASEAPVMASKARKSPSRSKAPAKSKTKAQKRSKKAKARS